MPNLLSRLKQSWFPLLFLALFAWLDWIMHRSLFFIYQVGGFAAAIILLRPEIRQLLGGRINVRLHPVITTLLWAAPALIYFIYRGQGTSAAGVPVVIAVCGTLIATAAFGEQIDAKLAGYYRVRDRIVPPVLAGILVLVVPILISFAVIHGSLSDLPALLGGSTETPLSPRGLGFRFFAGTLLATVFTILMTRRPAR